MNRITEVLLVATMISGMTAAAESAGEFQPTWASLDQRPIPAWFQEAKFGIFVHWGIYSVPAWRPLDSKLYASYAEWYYARVIGDQAKGGDAFHRKNFGEQFEYRDFAPLFKAELFDPEFWASLFRQSGAKYVVLTSKHHDGFCLWPTRSPYKHGWNSMETGPHRDLVGELSAAVRRHGLKMGLYYSIIEWESCPTRRHPSGYFLDKKIVEKYGIPRHLYVDEHLLPQLRELVLTYQPSVLFADSGEWDEPAEFWRTREFLAWLYNQAPNRDEVVVNDRWCLGMPGQHGDYYSSEYADAKVDLLHPWEESRGIGGSYGYNRAENLDDYRTSRELIHEMIQVVSRGGNFLLNVGPTADGRIPVIQQQRLRDIGNWLKVNGDAIYGTMPQTAPSIQAPDFIRFTRKNAAIYLICLQWPTSPIVLRGAGFNSIQKVRMLGSSIEVEWVYTREAGLRIVPPEISPATAPCEHAYVFRIDLHQQQKVTDGK